jgi:hypothetical protein
MQTGPIKGAPRPRVTASYDTLRRFALEELARRKKPTTVRVADTEPGEVAQVDFGLMGTLVDPTSRRYAGTFATSASRTANAKEGRRLGFAAW